MTSVPIEILGKVLAETIKGPASSTRCWGSKESMIHRRALLRSLIAAPAIVPASSLMRLRGEPLVLSPNSFCWELDAKQVKRQLYEQIWRLIMRPASPETIKRAIREMLLLYGPDERPIVRITSTPEQLRLGELVVTVGGGDA